MAGLVEALRRCLERDVVVSLKPLLLGTPERLRRVKGKSLLVTADLDDPLALWKRTKDGRRLWERVAGWYSLAELAGDPGVAAALEPRRTHLPTEMALSSPRLRPALDALLPALGRCRRNQMNWTFVDRRELLATLYAHNAVTSEGLRLRLTHEGLERWPALKGPEPVAGKYPVSWLLSPEAALDVASKVA